MANLLLKENINVPDKPYALTVSEAVEIEAHKTFGYDNDLVKDLYEKNNKLTEMVAKLVELLYHNGLICDSDLEYHFLPSAAKTKTFKFYKNGEVKLDV